MSTNKYTIDCWSHVDIYILTFYMLIHLCNGMHGGPISVILDQTSPQTLAKKVPMTPTRISTLDLSQITKSNAMTQSFDKAFKDPTTSPVPARSQHQQSRNGPNANPLPKVVGGQARSGPDTIPSRNVQLTDILINNGFGTVENSPRRRGNDQVNLRKSNNADIGNLAINNLRQEQPTNGKHVNYSGRKSLAQSTNLNAPVNTAVYPDWLNAIFDTLPSQQTQPLIQNIQNNYVDKLSIMQNKKSKQTTDRNMVHGRTGLPTTSSFDIHKPSVSISRTTENRNPLPASLLDKIILQSQGNSFSNLIPLSPNQQVAQQPLPSTSVQKSHLQIFNTKPSTPVTQLVRRVSARGDTVTFNVETSADQTLLNDQQYQMISSSKLPVNEGLIKKTEQILKLPQVGVDTNPAAIQQTFNHFSGVPSPSTAQHKSSSLPKDLATNVETAHTFPVSKRQTKHFQSPSAVAEQTQTASSRGSISIEQSANIPQQQSTNHVSHAARSPPVQQTIRRLSPADTQVTFNIETSSGTEMSPSNINRNIFESPSPKHTPSQVTSNLRTDQSGFRSTTSQQQQQRITAPFIRFDPSGKPVTFNVETSSVTSSLQNVLNQVSPLSGNEKQKSAGTDPFLSNTNSNVFESPISQTMQSSATSALHTSQADMGITSTRVDPSSGNQHEQHQISSIQRYSPSGKAVTFNVETNGFQSHTMPETQKEPMLTTPFRSSTTNKHSIGSSPLDHGTFESMPSTMHDQQSQGFIMRPATGINTQNVKTQSGNLPIQPQQNNLPIYHGNQIDNSLKLAEAEKGHAQFAMMLTEIALQTLKAEPSHRQNLGIPREQSQSMNMQKEVHHTVIPKEPVQYHNHMQTPHSSTNSAATSSHVGGNTSEKLDTLHTILHLIIDELRNSGMTYKSKHRMVQTNKKFKAGKVKHILKTDTFNQQPLTGSSVSEQHSSVNLNTMPGKQIKNTMSKISNIQSSPHIGSQKNKTNAVQSHNEHTLDSSWLHPMTIRNIQSRRPKHQQQQFLQQNQQLLQQNQKHPQLLNQHQSHSTQSNTQQLLLKKDQQNQQIQQQPKPEQLQTQQQQTQQQPSAEARNKKVSLKQHQQNQQLQQQQIQQHTSSTQPYNQKILLKRDQHNQQIQQHQQKQKLPIQQQLNQQPPTTKPDNIQPILQQNQQNQFHQQQQKQQQHIQHQLKQQQPLTQPQTQQMLLQQNHQHNTFLQQQQQPQSTQQLTMKKSQMNRPIQQQQQTQQKTLSTQQLTLKGQQKNQLIQQQQQTQQKTPSTQQLTLKGQQKNQLIQQQQQAQQKTPSIQPQNQQFLMQQIQQQQLQQQRNQQHSSIQPDNQHILLNQHQQNHQTQQKQQTSQHLPSALQHNQNMSPQQNYQHNQLVQQQQQTQKQQNIQQPLKQHKQQPSANPQHQLLQQRQLNQQDQILLRQKPRQDKRKTKQQLFQQNEIYNQQQVQNSQQAHQHKDQHNGQLIQFNHRVEINQPQQQKQQQRPQHNVNQSHQQHRQVLSSSQQMSTQHPVQSTGSSYPTNNNSPSLTELTFHIPPSGHGNVVLELQGNIGNIGNITYGH